MNILFVTDNYKPGAGGISEYTHNLATQISIKCHQVVVIAPKTEEWKEFDERQEIEVARYPDVTIIKYIYVLFMCASRCIGRSVDWICLTTILPGGPIAILLSTIFGYNFSVTIHGLEVVFNENKRSKRLAKPFIGLILRHSDVLITVSNFTKSKIEQEFIIEDSIYIIPPGINYNMFRGSLKTKPASGPLEGQITLLTVARLVPRKGIDNVIRVLPDLIESYPKLNYRVIGDGDDMSRLKNIARKNEVCDSVHFYGYISDDELYRQYNDSDIFVMPNRQVGNSIEGFGIVFLEANCTGLPVIGGHEGGSKDAIINGETGILVDPNDLSTIEQSIRSLINDPELRESLGEKGRERVLNNFLWDHIAEDFVNILKKDSNETD